MKKFDLIELFEQETNQAAFYEDGSKTSRYVEWLENKLIEKLNK